MYLAQRKQSKSMCTYTRIYGRRRPSLYGRSCRSSNPQRYGTGTRIAVPYEPYHTVTVRSPIKVQIHQIPSIPLMRGEFGVRWKFEGMRTSWDEAWSRAFGNCEVAFVGSEDAVRF